MSRTDSTQIKITLPQELLFFIKSKAEKFGLPVSTYVKNLIIDDVKDIDVPVFQISERNEKKALKAIGNYKKGKTIKIEDIDEYFVNL